MLTVARRAQRWRSRSRAVSTPRSPVDAFVTTEVESTPLIERLSDEVYQHIRADANGVLAPVTTADGSVETPFECHVLVAHTATTAS